MINLRPPKLYSKAVSPQIPSREAWAWENDEKTWAACVRERRPSKIFSRKVAPGEHSQPAEASKPRFLKWEASVRSAVLELKLHVSLSASQKSRVAESFGHDYIPRCAIHVWVAGSDGTQLAEARGSICPKNPRSAIHVHWICRAKSCRERADDRWRLIEEYPRPSEAKRPWTIPQALLSILAKIGESFGMVTVELGAEDQGSKRLIQYYSDLGFSSTTHRIIFGELSMEASIASISAFAPQSWMAGLPLAEFNGWSWLWGSMQKPSLGSFVNLMGAPDMWHWRLEWPAGAEIQIRTSWLSDGANSKVTINVHLRRSQMELVYCRAVCRLKQRSVRVIWIGSSGSKPAHDMIRSRLLDGTPRSVAAGKVTIAAAVLGSVAALARWFSTEALELTVVDNGSGKLKNYLLSLGFEESGTSGDLAMSCKQLAREYCPKAWFDRLPPDSNLSMLAKVCDS